jgi:outer membrane scaffolding protein for murein synthesis (MipA/OmpV family)
MPLWEAGAGLSALSLPEYRGSRGQVNYFFPLPYLVYRGEIFRVDRKGIYGFLYQSESVSVNISVDGGAPVRSGLSSARSGMSELDPVLQVGPSVELCLLSDCLGDRSLQFKVPVRAVYGVDFPHFRGNGWVLNPQLNLDFKNVGSPGWNTGMAIGPLWAAERYHDYYYEVGPEHRITGLRPVYDAPGGYSGTLLILSVTRRFPDHWVGIFLRYDNLSGAVFEESPLVKTRHAFTAGLGFSWILDKASTLVAD